MPYDTTNGRGILQYPFVIKELRSLDVCSAGVTHMKYKMR
jgi:hypothetical protein